MQVKRPTNSRLQLPRASKHPRSFGGSLKRVFSTANGRNWTRITKREISRCVTPHVYSRPFAVSKQFSRQPCPIGGRILIERFVRPPKSKHRQFPSGCTDWGTRGEQIIRHSALCQGHQGDTTDNFTVKSVDRCVRESSGERGFSRHQVVAPVSASST